MIRLEAEVVRPEVRSINDIERDDIVRRSLEEAAVKVERLSGNQTYTQAWKIAARMIRSMKP